MPNHVINRLEFDCPKERLDEILTAICYDEGSDEAEITGPGIAQRYEAGKQYAELLISNYDTIERINGKIQLSLFDSLDESKRILKERKIVWKAETSM